MVIKIFLKKTLLRMKSLFDLVKLTLYESWAKKGTKHDHFDCLTFNPFIVLYILIVLLQDTLNFFETILLIFLTISKIFKISKI